MFVSLGMKVCSVFDGSNILSVSETQYALKALGSAASCALHISQITGLDLSDPVASGQFGNVYRAQCNRVDVAVKEHKDHKDLESFVKEVQESCC